MENQEPAVEQGSATPDEGETVKEFAPIDSQEEFDKRIGARIKRESEKFQNYEEYKAAHEELEKIKEADKTELQRAAERAEAAEARLAEYETAEQEKAWKQEVSEATGVPADALRGATKEELEQHAESIKRCFAKDAAPVVSGDGMQPGTIGGSGDPLRDLIKNI